MPKSSSSNWHDMIDDTCRRVPTYITVSSGKQKLGTQTLQPFKAPRTCHELKEMGVETSGKYFIDPDGPWMGAKPVEVFCNMKTGFQARFTSKSFQRGHFPQLRCLPLHLLKYKW
jgi:hypothetical protein